MDQEVPSSHHDNDHEDSSPCSFKYVNDRIMHCWYSTYDINMIMQNLFILFRTSHQIKIIFNFTMQMGTGTLFITCVYIVECSVTALYGVAEARHLLPWLYPPPPPPTPHYAPALPQIDCLAQVAWLSLYIWFFYIIPHTRGGGGEGRHKGGTTNSTTA